MKWVVCKRFLIIVFALLCAVCCLSLGCKTTPKNDSGATGGQQDQTQTDDNNQGGDSDEDNSSSNPEEPPTESEEGPSTQPEEPAPESPEPDNPAPEEPAPAPEEGEDEKEWNISAKPVTATLVADGDNYVLNVTGTGEMINWAKAEDVPWYQYSEDITSVVIGEGVTSIGDYAFSDTNVKSVIIPEGVKKVGSYALPDGVDAYVYADTQVQPLQNTDVTVNVYSKTVPETYDRHWTSWGSSGNITDAPFVEETPYWYFDESGNPVLWEKIKVLFIGNSFTFYYQIPAQFDAIATDLGYYVETYSIAVPAQTLEAHSLRTGNSGTQITALLDKISDFDYVILQEHSTRPITDYNKFLDAASALKQQISETQDHAQVYLYQTWGFPNGSDNSYEYIAEMEQNLYEAYTSAASALNCNVSPVGRAFTYVKGNTDLNLYFGDNKHPGAVGSYLGACVHVAAILGGDVRKTTLIGKDLVVIANEGTTAQPLSLNEEQCETLRAAAYSTVFENVAETETYTVNFWYNGQLQSSRTAIVGLGFTLPACDVNEGERFSGWKLGSGENIYAANTRIGYATVSGEIEDGVVNLYAQTLELVIAVWGRWITESNFRLVMNGFEAYCEANELDYGKVGYVYYAGKTQNVDPYFLIANFTSKVAQDGADIVFPCAENISTNQNNIAIKEFKALGVSVEGDSTRGVAKLNDNMFTNAFYDYITTAEALEILGSLS